MLEDYQLFLLSLAATYVGQANNTGGQFIAELNIIYPSATVQNIFSSYY